MRKFFLFSLLAVLAISCNKGESSLEIFSKTIEIKHEKMFAADELILEYGDIFYFDIDSSLIIKNFKDDSLLIKIQLKDKKVSQFIPLGNGPDELINIAISQKDSDSTLLIQDKNSSKLFQWNILSGELTEDFRYEDNRVLRMVKLNDHYISTGVFKEGMFSIWNDKNSRTYEGVYPEDNMYNTSQASKALAYQGKLLVNYRLDRLLFCSTLFSYFELFQFTPAAINSIKKSYVGDFKYVASEDENIIFAHPYENNREGYIDSYATDKRVYLLYSGRSIEDTNVNSHEKARLANQIHVYDWNGKPIKKFEADVDLEKICINETENIIYAIAYNPDPEIVYFKLL